MKPSNRKKSNMNNIEMDMLRGCAGLFDWISPLAAIMDDIGHGPLRLDRRTLRIDRNYLRRKGLNPHQLRGQLFARGIQNWSPITLDGEYHLTIDKKDTERLEIALDKIGVRNYKL